MASTIKLKNGSGAPTSGQLVQGEPALDLTNKRLYTENASGTVIEVGTNPSSLTTASADINGGTIDGTVIGGSSAAAGSFTTISASGEIAANGGVAFGDNDKATFGDSDDLQIYHDGTNSYIDDAGTGNLRVRANSLELTNADYTQSYLQAVAAGSVSLFHAGNAKLATTATGIDVTGTVTADGLNIGTPNDLNSAQVSVAAADNAFIEVESKTTQLTAGFMWTNSGTRKWTLEKTGTNHDLFLQNSADTTSVQFHQNNDISFYEDTGTTAKFFWDASAESLGIGTTSPVAIGGYSSLTMNNTTGTFVEFQEAGTNRLRIGGDNGSAFINGSSGTLRLLTSDVERARLDSSGNWLVGTTSSTAPHTLTSGSGGAMWNNSLYISIARTSDSLFLNRIGSDGGVARFYRDGGTDVGSISVTASTTAYNITSDYRLKENVVSMDNASDRVLALNPVRFNFIADPDKTVDGFLAHEAQEVVPEAVHGVKDEVDDEGNPVYQGIDQSKLVPLLTKALQEALERIAVLESKVGA